MTIENQLKDQSPVYTAEMPDTFDLVERAKWVINAATGSVDMENDCAPAHYVGLLKPGIGHHSGEFSDMPEYLEDLPRMRSITGSKLNLDICFPLLKIRKSGRVKDYWMSS